jgi:hypothetical protein
MPVLLLISCAYTSVYSTADKMRTKASSDTNHTVGVNESVVVFKRGNNYIGSANNILVFLNDKQIGSVRNGQETSFIIPNGQHTIKIQEALTQSLDKEIIIEANSQKIAFAVGFHFVSAETVELVIIKVYEVDLETNEIIIASDESIMDTGRDPDSFDFFYSSDSIDMLIFYQDEMSEYLKWLNDGVERPLYLSAYLNSLVKYNDQEPYVANMIGAGFIRFNDNFLIPLAITMNILGESPFTIGIRDNWKDNRNNMVPEFLFSSGIIHQSRFGTIGFSVGYKYNAFTDDSTLNKYYDYGQNNGFKYALIPVINTEDYPLVGAVFKKLSGFVNTDFDEETNYSIKLVSQPFKIGNMSISKMEPYYTSKPHSTLAHKNVYGLLSVANINDAFPFFLDVGYTNYFDVIYESSLYDDSPYIRFGFPIEKWRIADDFWYGLSFYMDKEFIVPKIGFFGQIIKGMLLFELGFYQSFNLVMSYRLML